MDAIIPGRRLEVLQEKVDAWREMEAKAIEKYCNLIEVMTDVADNIDGHPAEATRLISLMRSDLERMEQRFISSSDAPSNSDGHTGVLKMVMVILSWIVASGVGVLIGLSVGGIG